MRVRSRRVGSPYTVIALTKTTWWKTPQKRGHVLAPGILFLLFALMHWLAVEPDDGVLPWVSRIGMTLLGGYYLAAWSVRRRHAVDRVDG